MNNRSFYYLGFMLDFSKSYSDMAQRILIATQTLIANEGLSKVSTHKVAKQAGISVGTIYLHFKDKDDLLNQLICFLLQKYNQHLSQNYDPKQPLIEQYRQFMYNQWAFFKTYPKGAVNIYQYHMLPQSFEIIRTWTTSKDIAFNMFILQGQQQKVIVDLPIEVIYKLTLKPVSELAYLQLVHQKEYDEKVFERMINCSWKAITI